MIKYENNKQNRRGWSPLLILVVMALQFSSCIPHKALLNFNDEQSFPDTAQIITVLPNIVIQTDDELSIFVSSLDMAAASPFNLGSGVELGTTTELGSSSSGGSTSSAPSYLVDQGGLIDFPVIGKVHLAGLTVRQAKDTLTQMLTEYIRDPIVNIRFSNFRITILGEVKNSSTFTFPDENITILEALGQAGDLTEYADRQNILVIREVNGERSYGTLNLQSKEVFQSPYFYLQQNDVVYIEPLKYKAGATRDQVSKYTPIITAAVGVASIILSFTR